MAAWHVVFTETAVEDIREAARYQHEQLGAPRAALAFLDTVEQKITLLETQPEACALVRDFELAKAGYRWCSVRSFLMFFTLDADARVVNVERVLYGSRDWKMLL